MELTHALDTHRYRGWVIKTHYPERNGYKPFDCGKVILLVRNPFDAIDSYFNMILTRTHTKSLDETEYERYVQRIVLRSITVETSSRHRLEQTTGSKRNGNVTSSGR